MVQLRRSGLADGGIGYRYRYSYKTGCVKTQPDELEYLLPVAEGRTTDIGSLFYIGEIINEEKPAGFYSLSFSAENGDKVYAARGGTVVEVVDEHEDSELEKYFTSNYNYVRVVHDDCTFANYRHLKKGSITVRPGDKIYAGDPFAQVVPRKGSEDPRFRLMITYLNSEHGKNEKAGYWKYVVPEFRTGNKTFAELKAGQSYGSVHPEKVITQEMRRAERRHWKRRH